VIILIWMPAFLGLGDAVGCLGPGRILHPDESLQSQLADHLGQVVLRGVLRRPVASPLRESEHPQALVARRLDPFVPRPALVVVEVDVVAVGSGDGRAQLEDHRGGALDEESHVVAVLVERRHVLPIGRERDVGDPWQLLFEVGLDETRLLRQHDERPFGRVALHLAVVELGVVAQGRDLQHPAGWFAVAVAVAADGDVALGLVALAADLEAPVTGVHDADRHLVQRQRAGLVGAHHGRRAEGVDGMEVLHDGAPLGHRLHPEREGHGDDRREALGNRGDREHDAVDQCFSEGVPAQHRDGHDRGGSDQRDGSQLGGEVAESRLEGGLPVLALAHLRRDLAHLGVHPGVGDDDRCLATDHRRAHERLAGPLGERRTGLGRLGLLVDRRRLAGQRRLVDRHVARLDHPSVGRYAVARLEEYHVTGDQLGAVDVALLAIASYTGREGEQLLE
jgi:hypothetical protein